MFPCSLNQSLHYTSPTISKNIMNDTYNHQGQRLPTELICAIIKQNLQDNFDSCIPIDLDYEVPAYTEERLREAANMRWFMRQALKLAAVSKPVLKEVFLAFGGFFSVINREMEIVNSKSEEITSLVASIKAFSMHRKAATLTLPTVENLALIDGEFLSVERFLKRLQMRLEVLVKRMGA